MNIDELLKRFPKGNPPFQVDVGRALDEIIGSERVYRIPFSKNIDGMLIFIAGEPFVLINTAQPKRRIHWTEAHELAEFFLHKASTYQSIYFSLHAKDIRSEREVNILASEMLMPKRVLLRFFREIKNLRIEEAKEKIISHLSNKFFVSEEAVRFRLKGLNLI